MKQKPRLITSREMLGLVARELGSDRTPEQLDADWREQEAKRMALAVLPRRPAGRARDR